MARDRFPTTHLSVVLGTGSAEPGTRRRSFEVLVAAYWRPVCAHVRLKWRQAAADAEDLTQSFFARALEKDFFAGYHPARPPQGPRGLVDRRGDPYWFDSMGSCRTTPAQGRLDGNRLVFAREGPMGHSRCIYDLQADGRYHFAIEHSQDGKAWTKFMDGTYRRT